YTVPGTYYITLHVTNQGGCTDSITKSVIVHDVPVAAATASDTLSCGPMDVTFGNTSTGATGYYWNFGDGTTSTAASPVHNYSNPGTYSVILVTSNAFGCSDTLILPQQIVIKKKPVAAFTAQTLSGCTPFNAGVTNNSSQLQNPVYNWNFGNGLVSQQANPSVNYTTGGNYQLTLIVTNDNGCADTASQQITANTNPVASASTTDTVGCNPHAVIFSNTSQSGTSWLWNFGDGTTSASQSPSHSYSQSGTYTVSLIVTGAGGCADTTVLTSPVTVYKTPVASFTPSALSGCTSLQVSFTNTSTQLDNPAYLWNFGNGSTSTLANPTTTYVQDGNFAAELIVTNQGGCSDSAQMIINSNLTPMANATVSANQGCVPLTCTFTNNSQNAASYLWIFGDGTSSSVQDPQHTYTNPGTYQPYLVAWSAAGCIDTFYFAAPIVTNAVPVAGFTVDENAGCAGTQFNFTQTSTPATGLTYSWNIGGNVYSGANPAVVLNVPGIYSVTLIVTNASGCSDTITEPNYIQVYDLLPPPVSPILSVSVKSDTQVDITWLNSAALDLGAYVLYRLNTITGQFVEIYRDNNPQNSATNVTSVYTDGGLSTLSTTYTYILETIDQCGNTLPLSALTPHTTINISASAAGQSVQLQWTPYSGCPVGSYEINRVEVSSGQQQLIATVPPGTLSYVDTGFYCPGLYTYRINATSLCGTTYSSLSDTAAAMPASPLIGQVVEVVRSTVVNDLEVLTEWLPPLIAPDRVVEYRLYRSTDNSSFALKAVLPAGALSYIDSDVDVHKSNYYYRVEVINDCQVQTNWSNRSSSILLNGEYARSKAHLWWTDYIFWDNGVDYYIIEQETQPGMWDPVKTVPGNTTDTDVNY
ncbi:MAG TPA: PKD domain-containing protein, partial [Bacteroidia bacterium]|nr:PKD domain-containing protein [Bacteroidia bacterium]